MGKTIIINYGSGNIGKSTSLNAVYQEIKEKYPDLIKIKPTKGGDDILAVIEIKGIKIGIETKGDPGSRQNDSLKMFIREGCEIIIVACRSRGTTLENIRKLERDYGYQLIYAQHAINPYLASELNKSYAQYIVSIIDKIINKIL